ncbi:hypothetical protein SG34_000235 [Thalassomonas viridans]|uniref:Uncharacterized protein n=1 Tax=Thalassomonas viridans TaxID=137584 RepID=A0AAF0C9F5_9GAMM|nr:hypothetical protein [Thalassomonas viridans]WDE05416.1 hypothetical protein SG34_000235 [Thalassomonas viridans]
MKIISLVISWLFLPVLAFAHETSNEAYLLPQTGCPCYLIKAEEAQAQLASVGLTPVGPDYPGGPIEIIDPGEQLIPIEPIDPCLPYPVVAPEPELTEVETYVDPIYIGGVMYKLTKADFTPVYRIDYIYRPCSIPEPVWVLTGYKTTIPVNGDYGQELNFEISGRSDGTEMALQARCGDFSAADSGSKYFISKTMVTNQTCQSMQLTFSFDGGGNLPQPVAAGAEPLGSSYGPSLIELNVIIAEAF